jgi:hypothetical protein
MKAYATLILSGDKLDLPEITRVLGFEPMHSHAKGEEYRPGVVAPRAVWNASTANYVNTDSTTVDGHLWTIGGWLLRGLTPQQQWLRAVQIKQLIQSQGAQATISVFWHGAADEREPLIDHSLIAMFGIMGFKFECDFSRDEAAAA